MRTISHTLAFLCLSLFIGQASAAGYSLRSSPRTIYDGGANRITGPDLSDVPMGDYYKYMYDAAKNALYPGTKKKTKDQGIYDAYANGKFTADGYPVQQR